MKLFNNQSEKDQLILYMGLSMIVGQVCGWSGLIIYWALTIFVVKFL